MILTNYRHFGGRHGESAALRNLFAFHGIVHPATGQPLSEALCFGIAGGIGAGYSFCPSMVRHGTGSGVSVVGRHRIYATDGSWYQNACKRLGINSRVTESTSRPKAYKNLVEELHAGRAAVVWCAPHFLPFLGALNCTMNVGMHTFVIHGVDEEKGVAHGSDRSPTAVTLTLDELAEARDSVCTHKNRTLTIDPAGADLKKTLPDAVRAGLQACARELCEGKMKTFSLPGFEQLAQRIANTKHADGWPRVFDAGLLGLALRDLFDSIETNGTGGGLYRLLYADFLDEAAAILKDPALAELAGTYRGLAARWTELADAALPAKVKPLKQLRDLLRKRRDLYEGKGSKAAKQLEDTTKKLRELSAQVKAEPPLTAEAFLPLLEELRERILALHAAEAATAARLRERAP